MFFRFPGCYFEWPFSNRTYSKQLDNPVSSPVVYIKIFLLHCVCVHAHTHACVNNTLVDVRGQLKVPGIKLRPSALAPSPFSSWAILQAPLGGFFFYYLPSWLAPCPTSELLLKWAEQGEEGAAYLAIPIISQYLPFSHNKRSRWSGQISRSFLVAAPESETNEHLLSIYTVARRGCPRTNPPPP